MTRTGNPQRRVCVGARWRALQAKVYRRAAATGYRCEVCGERVDMSLRVVDEGRHPEGPSVDHRVPKQVRPDLALVLSNLQLAHNRCNSAKGTRVGMNSRVNADIDREPVLSREW